ncbi:phage capsid protein [Rickettsiales bacterium LUAb2]
MNNDNQLSISDLHAESYHHAVNLSMQQKGSRLSACVREEVQNTERAFYDQIGPTEAIDIKTRHESTPLIDTKYDRRMILLQSSDWADLIDKEDNLHVVKDPTSSYVLNAAYALGRKKDQRIIEAALGVAYTGKNGTNLVNLPESQKITSVVGSEKKIPCGLTVEKLRMAREVLDDAEVDDEDQQYCIVTAKQISDLLRAIEVTSEDYNTVRALVDGKINTFLGFTFKRVSSNLLAKNSETGERSIICIAKSAIVLATKEDIVTDISYRKDKRMAIQVYASISCGASRMNEKQVVEILAKE